MAADSHTGTPAFTAAGAAGGSARCLPTISCDETPSNGGAPVTIWKSTAPNE